MAIIKKKIHPKYFDLVAKGRKKFEFRIADFDVKEGDMLVLEEWDPEARAHTGRSLIKKVGYIKKFTIADLQQEFGLTEKLLEQHGFYIIQLD
ncbi:MAG: hypothetical protein A2664_02230 [Candidatus Taylorbacteria bacterium RIFCSPHIGHO2_01_FULL_46_22b]|uniref:DUF3850 domain-containing protein n=1 Tax=Candidatus Taylorbacteria bacterium RIFCSPHIGHO2_01_FULL_46_22b TaxID=1802301 RepID=A0A1G2M575_9BACT|nr:MAG: hypothetical protein A2664_02230 [Candidatus Taylorbacteria bacterium RIFCSPHIGHO2_01_FULL_46_22b]